MKGKRELNKSSTCFVAALRTQDFEILELRKNKKMQLQGIDSCTSLS